MDVTPPGLRLPEQLGNDLVLAKEWEAEVCWNRETQVTNPEPTSTTSTGKGRNHREAGGVSTAPASFVQVCSAGFLASGPTWWVDTTPGKASWFES